MKKRFISDIHAGDKVDDIFMLSEKAMAQKKDGNNYLVVTLADKTGALKGVVWDNVEQISAGVSSGDFVEARGTVSEYRRALQLVVKQLRPCPEEALDPSDFLPTTSLNIEHLFERLVKVVGSIEDRYLKALFDAFWEDPEFVAAFKKAPAAKKMHHAYLGGLLEHCLSMAVLADRVAKHYTGVDRDLLLAGTVLHDIGKIREYKYKTRIDYSDEGRLITHIVIGVEMLDEKLQTIADFPEERALLLKHMIISHHGERAFGSPEPPKTIEALLLNLIDEMDSKVNGIRTFMAGEDPGEIWTSYHRLLERHFYRGKPQ